MCYLPRTCVIMRMAHYHIVVIKKAHFRQIVNKSAIVSLLASDTVNHRFATYFRLTWYAHRVGVLILALLPQQVTSWYFPDVADLIATPSEVGFSKKNMSFTDKSLTLGKFLFVRT